jgi:hypothetical protein
MALPHSVGGRTYTYILDNFLHVNFSYQYLHVERVCIRYILNM